MLKNTHINREATKKVAHALEGLSQDIVYVGGAIVSLYVNDPAADDVRPTKDVDISLEIHSLGQLEQLRENLNKRGFKQSHKDDVICRFHYEDVMVDVMTTTPVGWAPANRWFVSGFKQRYAFELEETSIYLMPIEYFLASKFDAFSDRGGADPRTSHDFEDIVHILNFTTNLSELLQNSDDSEVKLYLKSCFQQTLDSTDLQEAIIGNLYYEYQAAQYQSIMETLTELTHVL